MIGFNILFDQGRCPAHFLKEPLSLLDITSMDTAVFIIVKNCDKTASTKKLFIFRIYIWNITWSGDLKTRHKYFLPCIVGIIWDISFNHFRHVLFYPFFIYDFF